MNVDIFTQMRKDVENVELVMFGDDMHESFLCLRYYDVMGVLKGHRMHAGSSSSIYIDSSDFTIPEINVQQLELI